MIQIEDDDDDDVLEICMGEDVLWSSEESDNSSDSEN
jgi:hypothetical protein